MSGDVEMQSVAEMDRRRFLQASAGAVGALALAACTKSKSTGASSGGGRPTLRLNSGQIINSYPAPFSYFQAPGYGDTVLMFDTLLQADATGQLLPWLATRYEPSSDGMVHFFELRNGVRWHDGQPFTADDVAFTFDYVATKTLPRQRLLGLPDFPVHARVTGPQTIELSLERPVVTFAQKVLATLPIVPQHIWSSVDDPGKVPQDPRYVIGTGPYRLDSFNQGESTSSYVANDDFFLGKPFVQRIEYKPVDDELAGLLTGDLSQGSTPPAGVRKSALTPFRNNNSFEITESPNGFFIPLKFSIAKGGALADVRFRQACAKAINRDDMVSRLLDGQGQVGNPGLLPKDHPYHVDVEQYPFDPAGANNLLDAAGYTRSGPGAARKGPDGRPLRFNLLMVSGSAASELVISQLGAVGIELVPQSADPLTIINKGGSGDYEMAVAFGGGQSGDPDFLRESYSSKIADNFSGANGYANPQVDDLAERQLYTIEVTQRKALIAEIQRIVARDVPIVPLYYSTNFVITRKGSYKNYADPSGVTVLNTFKHHYVTGEPNGLKIRQA